MSAQTILQTFAHVSITAAIIKRRVSYEIFKMSRYMAKKYKHKSRQRASIGTADQDKPKRVRLLGLKILRPSETAEAEWESACLSGYRQCCYCWRLVDGVTRRNAVRLHRNGCEGNNGSGGVQLRAPEVQSSMRGLWQ
jgi:hypothetical protein